MQRPLSTDNRGNILNLDQATRHQRILSGIHSFIKVAGTAVGTVGGGLIFSNPFTGAVGAVVLGFVGNKIPDWVGKPDVIEPQIKSYLTKLDGDVKRANSFDVSLDALQLVTANIQNIRTKKLDARYDNLFLAKGIEYSHDLFSILQNEVTDIQTNFNCFRKTTMDLLGTVSTELKGVNESMQINFNSVNQQLAEISSDLQGVAKEQFRLIANQALSEQDIQENNRLLIQFGQKVDEDLLTIDQSYRVVQVQLNQLLKHKAQEQAQALARQKQAEIHNNFATVRSTFSAIQVLGQTVGNEKIAQIGAIGQVGAKIAENVCQLTGGFGMAQVTGFAALGPISAIAIAGLTLFSFFRRKKSRSNPMRELSKQIQQLGKMLQQQFNQVYKRQEIILNAIQRGIGLIMENIEYRFISRLEEIENTLLEVLKIGIQDRQELRMMSLHGLITKSNLINDTSAEESPQENSKKALKYSSLLANWLTQGACSPMLTGKNRWNGSKELSSLRSNNVLLEKVNSIYLLQFIALGIEDAYPYEFPKDVNLDELPNIELWSEVLKEFKRVQQYVKSRRAELEPAFKSIEKIAKNYQRFIQYLRTNDKVQVAIIQRYRDALAKLQKLVNNEFVIVKGLEYKQQLPEHFNKVVGLIDMMKQSERSALYEHCLQELKYCHNLLDIINQLVGHKLLVDDSFTRKEQQLMQYHLDWSNKSKTSPNSWQEVNNSRSYNTFRVVSTCGKIYTFILSKIKMIVECYDPTLDQITPIHDEQNWPDRANHRHPVHCSTFQCAATTINGVEYIISAIKTSSGIEFRGLNLQTHEWEEPVKKNWQLDYFKLIHLADNDLAIITLTRTAMFCHRLDLSSKELIDSSTPHHVKINSSDRLHGFNAVLLKSKHDSDLYISFYDGGGNGKHTFISYDLAKGGWKDLPGLSKICSSSYRSRNRVSLPLLTTNLNGKNLLLIAHLRPDGVHIDQFDTQVKKWVDFAKNSNLISQKASAKNSNYTGRRVSAKRSIWANHGAYVDDPYKFSFKATIMKTHRGINLVAFVCGKAGVELVGFDLAKKEWGDPLKTNLLTGKRTSNRDWFSTLRLSTLSKSVEHDELVFLSCSCSGLDLHHYKLFAPELKIANFSLPEMLTDQVKANLLRLSYLNKISDGDEKDLQLMVPLTMNDIIMAQSLFAVRSMRENKEERKLIEDVKRNNDTPNFYKEKSRSTPLKEVFEKNFVYIKNQMTIMKFICKEQVLDSELVEDLDRLIDQVNQIRKELSGYEDDLKEVLDCMLKLLRRCDEEIKQSLGNKYRLSNKFYEYVRESFCLSPENDLDEGPSKVHGLNL